MTTSDLLKLQIRQTPFNPVLALLLRDALADERDTDPAQVDDEVKQYVRDWQDAHEITSATKQLVRGAPYRERLHGLARSLALSGDGEPITVMVGPGDTAQVRRTRAGDEPGAYFWGSLCVVLGARLVLEWVARMQAGEHWLDMRAEIEHQHQQEGSV